MLMQISKVAIMKRALFYKLFLFLRLTYCLHMRKILFLLLFAASFVLKAQKPPEKFGDIPMEDMNMKVYPLDSSASAVVLFDYGVAYLSYTINDVNLYFERHTRIKILKKEGLGQADISVQLFQPASSQEKLTNLH